MIVVVHILDVFILMFLTNVSPLINVQMLNANPAKDAFTLILLTVAMMTINASYLAATLMSVVLMRMSNVTTTMNALMTHAKLMLDVLILGRKKILMIIALNSIAIKILVFTILL
jgi:hypothetical protein